MNGKHHWLLPEGIEEVLPPDAARLEHLCRKLTDLMQTWGYELVMPPLVEYLDALLTGTGEDLDLQTFKLTDQLSGRMMGVRADLTPQVARIDAHFLRRELPVRLCYLGSVLHTRPNSPGGSRSPLQMGAELYGHAGRESEAEILGLALRVLDLAQVKDVHVDLGHVGIYRGLVESLDLGGESEHVLFDILQRKAADELRERVKGWNIKAAAADMLQELIELNGGVEVLEHGRRALAAAGPRVLACIDELERVAELTARQVRNAPVYFDLAELRGYRYYTGVTFAAYVPGAGQGIMFGGRYDGIGAAFGRPRPATGFSTDMRRVFALSSVRPEQRGAVFAPCSELPGLTEAVEGLRQEGTTVICQLPGQEGDAQAMGCDRELFVEAGKWKTRRLAGK